MAASRWKSTLYASEQFVEACGAVVFDDAAESPRRVLLLYDWAADEWLLPKGRRNCDESRKAAAVREVREESGCAIRLRPAAMRTRAPSAAEAADVEDAPRAYADLTEPFMLDVRDLGPARGVKLVWWFVAECVRGAATADAEPQFLPEFVSCDKAVATLTFQKDREVLAKAIETVGRDD
ncbi:NUDIX domain-containing protein [Hypoxylon sp. FL1284]|nr:NUDIX domain-containing protein [Hypoxylon sp. FL1284]